MGFSDGPYHNYSSGANHSTNINSHDFNLQDAGNVPLLDLTEESNFLKNKKKSKVQVKREKTDREREQNNVNQGVVISSLKFQDSRNTYTHYQNHNTSIENRQERKKTFSDEDTASVVQNIINSRVSKASKYQ